MESLLAAIQAATEAFDFAHSTPNITCSLRPTTQTTDIQNYLPCTLAILGIAALYMRTNCLRYHAAHRLSLNLVAMFKKNNCNNDISV